MANVCNHCGTKLSDFKNSGLLGCPYCYGAFVKEIKEYVMQSQGSMQHVGKTPIIFGQDAELYNEYKKLLRYRQKALEEQKFDLFCELERKIEELTILLEEKGLK